VTSTAITYGTGGDAEVPVNPPAPAGGNGGATAPGVTANKITIGQLLSLTGPAPGVFQGVADSSQAYVDYVNSLGGVYGRKLSISLKDDSFDVVKAQAACENLVPNVFAMVSVFALGGTGCYPSVQSSGVPFLAPILYDPRFTTLPNVAAPRPNYYSNLQPAIQKALHPGIKKVWICAQDVPGIAAQEAPERKAWESLGLQVLNLPPLPSNAPDYTAAVVRAKNAGADVVDCFSTGIQVTVQVAKAMAQQGWKPAVKQGFSVYDANFAKLAGAAADGWSVGVQVPSLDPALFESTPGGKLYTKWVGHAPTSLVDIYGWEYMDLFVQALVKAGPKPTQQSLLTATRTFENFSANGLVPPFNAGGKGSQTTCLSLYQMSGGKLSQVAPERGKLFCGGAFFA
jgi:ABC-type branched-subunit amino acid transport system substrate-binding protein